MFRNNMRFTNQGTLCGTHRLVVMAASVPQSCNRLLTTFIGSAYEFHAVLSGDIKAVNQVQPSIEENTVFGWPLQGHLLP